MPIAKAGAWAMAAALSAPLAFWLARAEARGKARVRVGTQGAGVRAAQRLKGRAWAYTSPRISLVATPAEAVSTDNRVETPCVVEACMVT